MRTKDFDEEEILRKAVNIFWEKGYNGTSLHDLIDGLGIGRSSIYHAFKDKHALFVKALDLYQTENTAKIEGVLNTAPSLRAALETLLNNVISDVFLENHPKGCFKINSEVEVAGYDQIVCDLVSNDNLRIEEALVSAFTKARESGEIHSSKDPAALAHFFCVTISGMRVYAKFRTERQFFEDNVKLAISILD
ncbi:TetR/AcrR family transcriptional regulator [Pedobacter sp. MC2016-15]|jgi:TetR/AcrR family transcriptional repressor of nem operon|uniref:TetR/AcrR family transcriptional regulator n=1 Tax=Pedobacter sp. MC2016-15 TaxID=2994473 RepID=UPI0022482A29|nr:TetR/AcrR family transcriptional regulator [Pedobacter sp. MC2016-15]MCX2481486.1 TetR/AcrR family transcriptional regulator [Pedobacter sp. MC2016-15]